MGMSAETKNQLKIFGVLLTSFEAKSAATMSRLAESSSQDHVREIQELIDAALKLNKGWLDITTKMYNLENNTLREVSKLLSEKGQDKET